MSESQLIKLSIEGMTCASCVGRVNSTVADIPGVEDVAVNLAAETAALTARLPCKPAVCTSG